MLILSRKKNQTIHIGDNIRVIVSKIDGDVVKIGVEAPKEMPVHRGEVLERIKRGVGDEREQSS